jgi:CheY-like chemotaxis protein
MSRVLVIDDDAHMRRLLRQVLEKAGYDVVEAPNGEVGIDLFRTERPDVVITDMIMPVMGGVETIIHIRSDCEQAKIIAISGETGFEVPAIDLRVAETVGASRALAKPFSPSELLAAVGDLIDLGI